MQTKIKKIQSTVKELEQEVASISGQQKLLSEQIDSINSQIEESRSNIERYKKCVEVLRLVQISSQNIIREAFEAPGTQGLQFVFGDGHSLVLEFTEHGNSQHMEPKIISPEVPEPRDPMDTESGGKMAIANLILRLMILEVIHPRMDCPLVLDEPFTALRGKHLLEKAEEFLLKLQEKTNRQIIISTPQPNFRSDKFNVIKVGNSHGDTE